MRVNLYAEEATFECEEVMTERALETGGEVFDGIRFPLKTEDGIPVENAVTFWIPVDGYQQTAEMFYRAYQKVTELSSKRSRA